MRTQDQRREMVLNLGWAHYDISLSFSYFHLCRWCRKNYVRHKFSLLWCKQINFSFLDWFIWIRHFFFKIFSFLPVFLSLLLNLFDIFMDIHIYVIALFFFQVCSFQPFFSRSLCSFPQTFWTTWSNFNIYFLIFKSSSSWEKKWY